MMFKYTYKLEEIIIDTLAGKTAEEIKAMNNISDERAKEIAHMVKDICAKNRVGEKD